MPLAMIMKEAQGLEVLEIHLVRKLLQGTKLQNLLKEEVQVQVRAPVAKVRVGEEQVTELQAMMELKLLKQEMQTNGAREALKLEMINSYHYLEVVVVEEVVPIMVLMIDKEEEQEVEEALY